jgi:ribonuclease HII
MYRLCSRRYERVAMKLGWLRIAGLDEVGRGSLFGPVVAAAVVLNPKRRIVGLDDSKKINPLKRKTLSKRILDHALDFAIAQIDPGRIDAWNIYQASRQAMCAAIQALKQPPDYLLIDAIKLDLQIEQKSLIHGDARSVSIAAASIIAKVHRDMLMDEWHEKYPQYGLKHNRGYATPDHLDALKKHGPSPLHRYSFSPVRDCMSWAAGASQSPLPLEITDPSALMDEEFPASA